MNPIRKYWLAFLLLCTVFACQKTEFMPPPEGEKVPYEDTVTVDVLSLLDASPYTLFNTAFKRSSFQEKLKATISKEPFTLLVPNNSAMEAAGLTESVIDRMAIDELDSLLMFYTLRGKITKDELVAKEGNYEGISHLQNPALRVSFFYGDGTGQANADPYYYRHYLQIAQEKLLVNSISLGVDEPQPASNGYIWPLKETIPIPDKTFLEAMLADPRFSMFVQLQQITDSLYDLRYRKAYEEYMQWDPGPGQSGRNYKVDWHLIENVPGNYPNIRLSSFFAPTNDAFRQAGFQSVDDLLKLNERAPEFYFDEVLYTVVGVFPTDTLMSFQRNWGRIMIPYSGVFGAESARTKTVFYTNDLTNELLANYPVNTGQFVYIMPYHFEKDGEGKVMVQPKGSSYPAGTITETINTLMGPIHVVDRLLIPKDFKLN